MLGQQSRQKVIQHEVEVKVEVVKSQTEVKRVKFVTISNQGIVTGGVTAFGATSAQGVGVTAPSPPAAAPAAKQPSTKHPGKLPALNADYWSENLPKVYDVNKSASLLSQLSEGVRVGRPPPTPRLSRLTGRRRWSIGIRSLKS